MLAVGSLVCAKRPTKMMHEAERLRALAEQHRLTAFHAHGTGLLGWALCQQGQLARGAAAIEEAIAALDSIEFRLAISGFLGNLADAQRRLGNLQAEKPRARVPSNRWAKAATFGLSRNCAELRH